MLLNADTGRPQGSQTGPANQPGKFPSCGRTIYKEKTDVCLGLCNAFVCVCKCLARRMTRLDVSLACGAKPGASSAIKRPIVTRAHTRTRLHIPAHTHALDCTSHPGMCNRVCVRVCVEMQRHSAHISGDKVIAAVVAFMSVEVCSQLKSSPKRPHLRGHFFK